MASRALDQKEKRIRPGEKFLKKSRPRLIMSRTVHVLTLILTWLFLVIQKLAVVLNCSLSYFLLIWKEGIDFKFCIQKRKAGTGYLVPLLHLYTCRYIWYGGTIDSLDKTERRSTSLQRGIFWNHVLQLTRKRLHIILFRTILISHDRYRTFPKFFRQEKIITTLKMPRRCTVPYTVALGSLFRWSADMQNLKKVKLFVPIQYISIYAAPHCETLTLSYSCHLQSVSDRFELNSCHVCPCTLGLLSRE